MGEAFKAHLDTIEPGSPEAEELAVLAGSSGGLLAYSRAKGLDLTAEDAERVAADYSGRLNDGELDAVSGGRNIFAPGAPSPDKSNSSPLDWLKSLF